MFLISPKGKKRLKKMEIWRGSSRLIKPKKIIALSLQCNASPFLNYFVLAKFSRSANGFFERSNARS